MIQKTSMLLAVVTAGVLGLAGGVARGENGDVRRALELNTGIEQLNQGEVEAAAQTFRSLVETQGASPEQVRVYRYYLAIAHIRLGMGEKDRPAAQQHFRQASENLAQALDGLDPKSAEYQAFASAHLDRGLSMLMSGDAEGAVRVLKEVVKRSPSDSGTMLLGIAEYRTNRRADAINTLAPLAKDEKSAYYGYANFYTGLAQASLGDRPAAQTTLKRVAQMPGELGQRAQTVLDQVEKIETTKQKVSPLNWGLTLEMGHMYDTNVILLGDNAKPGIRVDNKDDYRFGLMTSFYLDYQPDEGELKDWHFNIGTSIYESWHASIGEYNVQDYAASVYIGRKLFSADEGLINLVEVGLRYDYDYSLVGNDGFLSRNSLAALFYFEELNRRARTIVEVGDQIRDYEEEIYSRKFDRDGNYWSATVLQEYDAWEVPAEWRYSFDRDRARYVTLRMGYRHDNNSTQGDEYDYDANTLIAGVDVPLPWNCTFNFGSEFEWQNYWQRSRLDFQRRGRDDFIQRYVFRLSHRVNRWLELGGEIAWTLDDSNVKDRLGEAVYSYDRVIYGLTARLTFPQ